MDDIEYSEVGYVNFSNGFIFCLDNFVPTDYLFCKTFGISMTDFNNIVTQFNAVIANDGNIMFLNEEDVQNAIVAFKLMKL